MGLDNWQAAGPVPAHLAIIMDGNGRWASNRGLPRAAGHRAGAKTTRRIVESAQKLGIGALTLFAFSSENWRRPRAEVQVLLDLFLRTLNRQLAELKANDVRLRFVGARERFSASLQRAMIDAEQDTQSNNGLQLMIAVDYGGRWDIVQAARSLATDCEQGRLRADAIDDDLFAQRMTLCEVSTPDLFIRTGGERRLSNFLLWDLAYSELYFTDTLWPDFDADKLAAAVTWYAARDRRFGRVSGQDKGR